MTETFGNDTQSTQKILSTTFSATFPTWGVVLIALISFLLLILILVGLILSLIILIRKKNRQLFQRSRSNLDSRPRHYLGNLSDDLPLPEPICAQPTFLPVEYYGLHGGNHSSPQAAFVLTPENHEISNITIAAVQGSAASQHTLDHPNSPQVPQAALVLTPNNHEIDVELPAIDVERNITSATVQGSAASQHTLDLPNSPQAPHIQD